MAINLKYDNGRQQASVEMGVAAGFSFAVRYDRMETIDRMKNQEIIWVLIT